MDADLDPLDAVVREWCLRPPGAAEWPSYGPADPVLRDPWAGPVAARASVDATLAAARGHWPDLRPSTALDVACGPGWYAAAMAERGLRTTGLDLAESQVDAARRLHARVPGCRFVLSRCDDLRDVGSRSTDLVHLPHVLTVLPHRRGLGLLEEARRVLAPGGVLALGLVEPAASLGGRWRRATRRSPGPRLTWSAVRTLLPGLGLEPGPVLAAPPGATGPRTTYLVRHGG